MTEQVGSGLRTREPFSGVRSLSGVLDRNRVMREAREASLAETVGDSVYGITKDGDVVAYRIAKWTLKRVYYVRERIRYRRSRAPLAFEYLTSISDGRWSETYGWMERADDSVIWVNVGYADRAELERDGQVRTIPTLSCTAAGRRLRPSPTETSSNCGG